MTIGLLIALASLPMSAPKPVPSAHGLFPAARSIQIRQFSGSSEKGGISIESGHFRLPTYQVWNGCSPVRWLDLPEDDVATTLPVLLVTDLFKCLHDFATRDLRQLAHAETSANSSEIGGGIGSSCAIKLST